MTSLKRGSKGDDVARLQALLCLAGCDAKPVDGDFGAGTERAVTAYQGRQDLPATGVADAATQSAIGMDEPDPTRTPVPVLARIDTDLVAGMFPQTRRANIADNLPHVAAALDGAGMDDRDMVLMALATIRAESAQFLPISEGKSKYNSSPGGDFDLYDPGTRVGRNLGNSEPGDGARFKGRGFIQLTGRANYGKYGDTIGLGRALLDDPERANDPDTAAKLLAAFLKAAERRAKYAILGRDLAQARKLVNGGSHGLDEFSRTFTAGEALLEI